MKIVLISVVRDFAMYGRCVRDNPHVVGCECVTIDNRARNEGIPVCYNRFLESRPADEEAWYVFCHEDFEWLAPPDFAALDTASLWGPIGAATRVRFGVYHQWCLLGSVQECRKDGSNRHIIGEPMPVGTPVETFNCQCLIVHSSLVRAHRLRFDEALTFDLYAEEFCIAAKERAGIVSRILPLAACHWSGGSVQPRYYAQEAHVNARYPKVCYTGTSSLILGGDPPFFRRLTVGAKRFARRMLSAKSQGKGVEDAGRIQNAGDVERRADGCGVHRFATCREQTLVDLGRVRVLVAEVSSQRGGDSDSCTGDTLSRILKTAEANGLLVDRERLASLGECVSKRTGESVVYWNEAENCFYKVKNPAAKCGLKRTRLKDWFLEYVIHNILFPETAYEFIGVMQECGELRIVLRQKNVSSETFPTEEQIASYLQTDLGLYPEDRYFFGNEFVAVTDVSSHSDNVLLDDAGDLRFIDPLIRLKRPATEVISWLTGACA